MKNRHNAIIGSLCAALLAAAAPALAGTPQSASTASGDTLRNVWVFFRDKSGSRPAPAVSPRAESRRRRAGFRDSESGRPVNSAYIREVERRGGTLRAAFPWGNAASFSISPSRLAEVSALPFVKSVSPVGVYVNKRIDDRSAGGLPKSAASMAASAAAIRGYDWHTEMVGVPLAHDYIRYNGFGIPGSGVLMAFFDGGFRVDHAAYKRLRDSSQVVAAYDFVDGDTLVADPDSISSNPRSGYYRNDRHGSQVLSLAAAYTPGVYTGTAYGASFALARTEDDSLETLTEEDNWLMAVMWADSVGADIISSSLGYRDGHTDPMDDYDYFNMDGKTTIISLAAAEALKRGIIVVNAMGNEGSNAAGTITAPADVDGVVSVGAVTINRNIASFSSTGPTYDGRMKPEVVAPGQAVPVAEPYSPDRASYSYVDGTSFSTPIVSAIMALILQTHPKISLRAAKERLYASCSFASGQNVVNNRFGYGIPNAALAIMGADEIFLKVIDSTKTALPGAVATFGKQTYIADSAGNILIRAQKSDLPARLTISYRDSRLTDTVTVDKLPFARTVELEEKWYNGLKVAPNITKKNGVIRGRYTFAGANTSKSIIATVRTLTGKKIWNQKLRPHPDGSVDFVWNVKGKSGTASGVYLVVIRHGYSVICERVVVSD